MARKLVIKVADGSSPVLEQVLAGNELQLQELLKVHPELLPLDELGLVGPAVVVGRESTLESGRVDLVLLGNGGDLALVEFKTGPQNPDFRECLARLLSYGSDVWGMTLEEFETRVVVPYFKGSSCPPGSVRSGASLAEIVEERWGAAADEGVDWCDRLQAQLRDGGFHYIAVAQRFTPPVLRTLRYLNATMKSARFSAVELVRFNGDGYDAFEARFVAGAEPISAVSTTAKTVLAGVDDLLAKVTDDAYRHALRISLMDWPRSTASPSPGGPPVVPSGYRFPAVARCLSAGSFLQDPDGGWALPTSRLAGMRALPASLCPLRAGRPLTPTSRPSETSPALRRQAVDHPRVHVRAGGHRRQRTGARRDDPRRCVGTHRAVAKPGPKFGGHVDHAGCRQPTAATRSGSMFTSFSATPDHHRSS